MIIRGKYLIMFVKVHKRWSRTAFRPEKCWVFDHLVVLRFCGDARIIRKMGHRWHGFSGSLGVLIQAWKIRDWSVKFFDFLASRLLGSSTTWI